MGSEEFPGVAEFVPVVRAAFGSSRRLVAVRRRRGGSKKGVYQLDFDDGTAVIGYVWSEAENYWATAPGPGTDEQSGAFSEATGAGLFAAAHSLLHSLGVRVPELYLLDQSRALFASDVAFVEHVAGQSLESLLDGSAPWAGEVVRRLRESLDVMHGHRNPRFGKIGELSQGGSCEQVVLERAIGHLAEAAGRLPRIAAARSGLEQKLNEFAAAIQPRSEHGLIHGELGPDHVLVDAVGRPVLIDIEGLMYFDVEWEHVFLQMRFRRHYELLKAVQLDEPRLRLYRLAEHLSLVAGPLRLADTDFPERDFMVEIAMVHTDQVLGYLQPP
jgi:hypothetical protein